MKIISNNYYLPDYFRRFFLIKNGKAEEIDFYSLKVKHQEENIYGEKYEQEESYPVLILNDIKKVSSNHIEANIKKDLTFYCGESVYLSSNLIKEIKTEEVRKEYHEGDISISYNTRVIFKKNILQVDTHSHYFARGDEPISKEWREDVQSIEDKISELKTHKSFFNDNEKLRKIREEHISFLEDKMREGFKYIVFQYKHHKKEVNELLFEGHTVAHEWSKEFKKADKLSKELKSEFGVDIYTPTLYKILKKYSITKKRAK